MASLREKINTLREKTKKISSATKTRFIAAGVSFVLLATSLTGCAFHPDNQTELEDKLTEIEAYVEMLEEELQKATIDKYVAEIEAYKQIVGELKTENDNLKSSNYAEISEKLDKVITLLEAIEAGSLKGEDLEGAMDAIKGAIEEQTNKLQQTIKDQTDELKQNMINPDGVPSTDKEQPGNSSSSNENEQGSEISKFNPLYEVETANRASADIARDIRTNIIHAMYYIETGTVIDYPLAFQFCEETQTFLKNGVLTSYDEKSVEKKLHEYQLLLVEKTIAPSFKEMDDSGYMKIAHSNVNNYNPNNPYIENLEYGINTSTGSTYCVDHSKRLDEFCGYFDAENKAVNTLNDEELTSEQDTENYLAPLYKEAATLIYKHVFSEIRELDSEFENFEIVDISEKNGVYTIECTGGTKTIESTDENSPVTSVSKAFPATYVLNPNEKSVVKTQHVSENMTNTSSHKVFKLNQTEFDKMVEAIQDAMAKAKANQQSYQSEQ